MTREQLKSYIKQAEAWRPHMYNDSEGVPTIGFGHNLTKPISWKIGEQLLDEDLDEAEASLRSNFPWAIPLDSVRYCALLEMVFNMGAGGLSSFRRALAAMRGGDWGIAAGEMLNSKWAKQVGKRADRLASWIRTGVADE